MSASPSSSSSSAAWSDSEDGENEGKAGQSQLAQPPANLDEAAESSRSRHGEKLPFQAPQGYLPSFFANSLMTQFGFEAIKSSREKQVWVIKIPEGISPNVLDGTVIKVPKPSSSSQSILAEVELNQASKILRRPQKYHLERQRQTRPIEDAVGSTQLIAMAGGNDLSGIADEHSTNIDLRSLRVLLPYSGTQAGIYLSTSRPIQEHLHMVLDEMPDDKLSRDSSKINQGIKGQTSSEKRKRKQPVGKLNGCFTPAGARSTKLMKADDDKSHHPISPMMKKISKSKGISPEKEKSPVKKSKKVKGTPKSK